MAQHIQRVVSHLDTGLWNKLSNASLSDVSLHFDNQPFTHSCCCRLSVHQGRLAPFECPTRTDGSVHPMAAAFALSYYNALLTIEALGFQLPDFDAYLSW